MNAQLLELVKNAATAACARNMLLVLQAADPFIESSLNSSAVWQRTAGGGRTALAWPETTGHDLVVLPLPRGKGALQFCLHAVQNVMQPNAHLILFGLNEWGIKSADNVLLEFFNNVEVLGAAGHGRVYLASGIRKAPCSIAQLRSINDVAVLGVAAPMATYPGLFAGGKLDEGTALLLDSMPTPVGNVLDYACGIGVIARAVQSKTPETKITVADHDPLALLAAAENVPGAMAVLTATPADIHGPFDVILSNPPIHIGNQQSFIIVDQLIKELGRLLAPTGKAVLVTQITVPVQRLAADHAMQCSVIAESRSFKVLQVSC